MVAWKNNLEGNMRYLLFAGEYGVANTPNDSVVGMSDDYEAVEAQIQLLTPRADYWAHIYLGENMSLLSVWEVKRLPVGTFMSPPQWVKTVDNTSSTVG